MLQPGVVLLLHDVHVRLIAGYVRIVAGSICAAPTALSGFLRVDESNNISTVPYARCVADVVCI